LPLLHRYSLIATANLAFFASIAPRIFRYLAAENSQPYLQYMNTPESGHDNVEWIGKPGGVTHW